MTIKNIGFIFGLTLLSLSTVEAATLGAAYSSDYTLTTYTSDFGVPLSFGGITFLDANTLLVGGNSEAAGSQIYAVPVLRGAGNAITGFGTATVYATAPYEDGGLAFGPGGTLFYTQFPTNGLGEITEPCTPTCSTAMQTPVSGLGITSSVGTLGFVPSGLAGAGNLILGSYGDSKWYNVTLTAAGGGLYTPTSATLVETTGGGPEGIVWVGGGNPDFTADTALVSQYDTGSVVAYGLDGSGAPTGTGTTFISGLGGAEGSAMDPITGDLVFSSYDVGGFTVVSGFEVPSSTPEPGSVGLFGLGLAGLGLAARRFRKLRS